MKFCFGYPHQGNLWYGFHESICNLLFHEWIEKPREECLIGSKIESGSCHVPFNRNDICRFFIQNTQDDYVVMVDTDVEFERDLLTRFANHITIESAKVPYWNRLYHPHIIAGRVDIGTGLPVFYKRMEPGEFRQDPRPFRGLKQFDMVGSGIIAISRYCLTVINRESGSPHWFSHREEVGKLSSDDFSFLMLAEKHGFKPFGAWDIRGHHIKPQVIPPRYVENVDEYEKWISKTEGNDVPRWLKPEFYDSEVYMKEKEDAKLSKVQGVEESKPRTNEDVT